MRDTVIATVVIMIIGYSLTYALIKLVISEIFNGKVRVIDSQTNQIKVCENALRFTKKD